MGARHPGRDTPLSVATAISAARLLSRVNTADGLAPFGQKSLARLTVPNGAKMRSSWSPSSPTGQFRT